MLWFCPYSAMAKKSRLLTTEVCLGGSHTITKKYVTGEQSKRQVTGGNHQWYGKSGLRMCHLPISFLSYSTQFLWPKMPSVLDPNCQPPSLSASWVFQSIGWLLRLHHASPFRVGIPLLTPSHCSSSVSRHQQKIHRLYGAPPTLVSHPVPCNAWCPNVLNFV